MTKKTKNYLLILIKEDKIFLKLYKNNFLEAESIIKDTANVSQKLLEKIDIFLAKEKLNVSDLLEVQTKISEKQKYTLARIVRIVVQTINYCLQVN